MGQIRRVTVALLARCSAAEPGVGTCCCTAATTGVLVTAMDQGAVGVPSSAALTAGGSCGCCWWEQLAVRAGVHDCGGCGSAPVVPTAAGGAAIAVAVVVVCTATVESCTCADLLGEPSSTSMMMTPSDRSFTIAGDPTASPGAAVAVAAGRGGVAATVVGVPLGAADAVEGLGLATAVVAVSRASAHRLAAALPTTVATRGGSSSAGSASPSSPSSNVIKLQYPSCKCACACAQMKKRATTRKSMLLSLPFSACTRLRKRV